MTDTDFLSIFLIALGLSADCFAVALSGGISNRNYSRLQILRITTSFGAFQALMLILGWLAGRTVVEFISDYDHWVAFALLAIVSGRMLWGSFRPERSKEKEIDITKGLLLIILSIATSIDALAVGLSFAFLSVNVTVAGLTVGLTAFLVTAIGFLVGKRASKIIGKRAEALGGIILLAISFRILFSHILQ